MLSLLVQWYCIYFIGVPAGVSVNDAILQRHLYFVLPFQLRKLFPLCVVTIAA